MAKFVPIMTTLLLIGLFSIMLILAGISFADQNGSDVNIKNDPEISKFYGSVNDTLVSSAGSSLTSTEALTNSTISTTGTLPYPNTLGGIWKVLYNTPATMWNLISGLLSTELLGSQAGQIIVITLGAILAITLIAAVVLWVMWGQGG